MEHYIQLKLITWLGFGLAVWVDIQWTWRQYLPVKPSLVLLRLKTLDKTSGLVCWMLSSVKIGHWFKVPMATVGVQWGDGMVADKWTFLWFRNTGFHLKVHTLFQAYTWVKFNSTSEYPLFTAIWLALLFPSALQASPLRNLVQVWHRDLVDLENNFKQCHLSARVNSFLYLHRS